MCQPRHEAYSDYFQAAYFVQSAVSSYENHFTSLQSTKQTSEATSDQVDEATKGKECSNLIVLVSELYNFQVISCILVYDLIKGLLDGELTEFKVELLLKITRSQSSYRQYHTVITFAYHCD